MLTMFNDTMIHYISSTTVPVHDLPKVLDMNLCRGSEPGLLLGHLSTGEPIVKPPAPDRGFHYEATTSPRGSVI